MAIVQETTIPVPRQNFAAKPAGNPQGQATICQLLHGLWVGGAEVLAARLARQNRDHYRFVFACLDELGTLGRELQDEGFLVEVINRRPGLDWRCSFRLAGFLRREKVDLIHCHQYTPFFYGMTARLLYRKPGVLFMEHGRHQPDYPRPKRIFANRMLLSRRDRVVGVGEAVRQALIQNEGFSPDRVSVIYNGIDLNTFAKNHQPRQAIRQELGFKEDDFLIFQVARLDYLKDHATAIRALARVIQQCPQAHLVLIGEGPELTKIQEAIRENKLEHRVKLLGLRKDIPRLLAAADVFLLTSISEGIPVTLIEAMASGLPIVSTNVGGVSEVVEDGKTGLLAPAKDDAGLAENLLKLAANPGQAQEMGSRGLARAEAFFSEANMHSRYCQLYEEMLRG